jgi:hypothetical protein
MDKVKETSLVIDEQEDSIIQVETVEDFSGNRGSQSGDSDKGSRNREAHC